jgi:hypothetical protein
MARVIAHIVPNALGMSQSIVDVTTADGEVLAAGTRKYLLVQNIGSNTIYLTFDGDTASSTTGFKLTAGKALEFSTSIPTGQIRGIADTATTKLAILQG